MAPSMVPVSCSLGGNCAPMWRANSTIGATDYLSQPHWAVGLNWNRFPLAPIVELARHMGAQFPPKLQLSGTMDGAIGYSGQGSLQGRVTFHDAALAIPASPALRAESWHAADLEAELMPTLRRSTNLLARALGRPMVTDWLRQRNLDGTVQIQDLLLDGFHLLNFRARLLWDVGRVQVDNIQAGLE